MEAARTMLDRMLTESANPDAVACIVPVSPEDLVWGMIA